VLMGRKRQGGGAKSIALVKEYKGGSAVLPTSFLNRVWARDYETCRRRQSLFARWSARSTLNSL